MTSHGELEQGKRPTLVERVEALLDQAEHAMQTAAAWDDPKAAALVLREMRECIRLVGQLTGELDDGRSGTNLAVVLGELQASGRAALAAQHGDAETEGSDSE